ncbi:MAG: DnaJ domain-containing protein [Candidatus Gastranaerophilales bacterium]|nr:DnaJ domain-containing protein [Candidatus Gastranaerophilales bacterium]
MNLFKRIENIIKSNINHNKDEIDINSYEDIYYDDSKEMIQEENKEEKKYYKILELEYGSDFKKIKSAYKKLLKKYHPDLFQNKPEKLKTAQEVTRQINEAYTYFERKYL